MKNIKKILSVVLVLLMVFSFAGCHKKGEIAVTIGDVQFTSAYYMCALFNADTEAKNLVYESLTEEEKSEEIDYYSKKVEDKDYVKWVEDTAMEYLKEIAAYKTLCKENELELDEEKTNEINSYADYYWQNYEPYYSINGIGEQTHKDYLKDSYSAELYFEHLYGKDGEKAISDEDVKTKIYDSFIIANILEASFTEDMTDNEKTELKTKLDVYVEELNHGHKTFEDVYNDYNNIQETTEEHDHDHDHDHEESESETAEPKDEYATVLGVEGSGYESDHYDTVKAMEIGEVKIIEVEDAGYALVVKQDISADEYYIESLDMPTRHLIKDEEFEKHIEEYANGLKLDINDYAVNQFKVKKIKEPSYE